MDNSFYLDAPKPKPQQVISANKPSFESDCRAIQHILSKTPEVKKYEGPDLFEESVFTKYFNKKVGAKTVTTIRSEFVSWEDVSCGTVREMRAVGIDVDKATLVLATLHAAKKSVDNRSMRSLRVADLKQLKVTQEQLEAARYPARGEVYEGE